MTVRRDIIVGLDAGTSLIKAVAFDLRGRELAVTQCRNEVLYGRNGAAEQDLTVTWQAAARTLRALTGQLPDLEQRIAGLAVTGQGDGTWLVDAEGEPVGRALLRLDARSGPTIERWRAQGIGQAVYRYTGCGLNTANQSGQLAWLREQRPQWLRRATTAFHCKDWLYFRLTGVRATDPSEAVLTFGSYRSRDYSPEVLTAFGLDDQAHLLPPIVDGAQQFHSLSPQAAQDTGLPAGTPVYLAPIDIICSALGGGVLDLQRNVACTVIGSTGVHMRLRHDASQVSLNDRQVGYTILFPMGESCAQVVLQMAATLNIDWLVSMVSQAAELAGTSAIDRRALLAELEQRLVKTQPVAGADWNPVIYHPFIAPGGERGPFVDPAARAQFLGLRYETGFVDLARAVYESIALAARDCFDLLGLDMEEVRVGGGAANSGYCRAQIAGALDVPVRRTSRAETGAAGAAALAAVALGEYDDLPAACSDWVSPLLRSREAPQEGLRDHYAKLFPLYRQGYVQTRPLWQAMRALPIGAGI